MQRSGRDLPLLQGLEHSYHAKVPSQENQASEPERARLIPVTGIKGPREAEDRATSALLAVLSVVRTFSGGVEQRPVEFAGIQQGPDPVLAKLVNPNAARLTHLLTLKTDDRQESPG